MQREILFKGKSKITGEWFFGNLFDKDTSGKTHIGTTTKGCLDIDPETVCQFAGFTDINGKKVFEGDYDKDGDCVIFCDECHGWQFGEIDIPTKQVCIPCHNCDGNFMIGDLIEKFEVVGNIND